jgi:lipoic acid synthetase
MPSDPLRIRTQLPESVDITPMRRPDYIRVRPASGQGYQALVQLMRRKSLKTVCEEAACPNLGECWGLGTATFLILGDVCSRACGFCDIKHGVPEPLDWQEPERVAMAVKTMGLKHAVVTSVNRDERQDGGAPLFAMVIESIHEQNPECSVEVLVPDFKGSHQALRIVMEANPEILNHNVETVPRLYSAVQKQDHLEWSRDTLVNAKKLNSRVLTKSGIMVGLGETIDEVEAVMTDLHAWGVDILTIGQYLQPSRWHLPIRRYYTLEEFESLKLFGLELGFRWVESGPLVRSSYHAIEQLRDLTTSNNHIPIKS